MIEWLAGRFILPFGLRFDDHTVFTRQPLGFHAISEDSGVELGIRPGPSRSNARENGT